MITTNCPRLTPLQCQELQQYLNKKYVLRGGSSFCEDQIFLISRGEEDGYISHPIISLIKTEIQSFGKRLSRRKQYAKRNR